MPIFVSQTKEVQAHHRPLIVVREEGSKVRVAAATTLSPKFPLTIAGTSEVIMVHSMFLKLPQVRPYFLCLALASGGHRNMDIDQSEHH